MSDDEHTIFTTTTITYDGQRVDGKVYFLCKTNRLYKRLVQETNSNSIPKTTLSYGVII